MSIKRALILCGLSGITAFSSSCGISGKGEIISSADIKDSFSCNAVIHYKEIDSDVTLKRYGKGMWENEFISPDTVAGVKLTFNNDEVTASYKGLEFSVPKSAMPFQSMLCCLIEATDSIYDSNDIACTENDGLLCYEGSIEQGDYKICFDSSTGFINSFEMPNMELEIEFSNCTENNDSIQTDISDTEPTEQESSCESSEEISE